MEEVKMKRNNVLIVLIGCFCALASTADAALFTRVAQAGARGARQAFSMAQAAVPTVESTLQMMARQNNQFGQSAKSHAQFKSEMDAFSRKIIGHNTSISHAELGYRSAKIEGEATRAKLKLLAMLAIVGLASSIGGEILADQELE